MNPATSGTTAPDVLTEPWRFHPVAALRELERRSGLAALREGSSVLLRGWPSMAFPPSDLALAPEGGMGCPGLACAFASLYGSTGLLPVHWTRDLLDALAGPHNDPTCRDFLDVINHRLAVLLYEAWSLADPGIAYERHRAGPGGGPDPLSGFVLDYLGVEPTAEVPAGVLVRYASLLASAPSRTALEQMLGDYFGVDVAAVACPDVGADGADFRIRVGPMSLPRYREFLPGGAALAPLLRLTRISVGVELDFDVELRLDPRSSTGCRLDGAGPEPAARLGWTSWPGGAGSGDGVPVSGVLSRSVCRAVERGRPEPEWLDDRPPSRDGGARS